jgi:hypothetical protein
MKEHREQQTMIDQLQNHILAQDKLVNAQNNVIQEQDKKIIDLAFDFEYQKHSNKLLNAKMDETLLADCREMIADLCDDNNLPYPVELLHRIGVALGETYEQN